jgi:adenylate kinase family enzyme
MISALSYIQAEAEILGTADVAKKISALLIKATSERDVLALEADQALAVAKVIEAKKEAEEKLVYCAVSFPETKMFVLTASVNANDKKTKEFVEKKTRKFYGGNNAVVNFYSETRLDELVKNGWIVKVNQDLRC